MESREALVFGSYLISQKLSPNTIQIYQKACSQLKLTQSNRVVDLCVRFPRLIGFLEAAIAILAPNHLLRKKLIVLSAIIETTPDHHQLYLPKNYSVFFVVRLCRLGLKIVFQASIGIPLFLVLEKRGGNL